MAWGTFLRVLVKFARNVWRHYRHTERVEDTQKAADELAKLEDGLDEIDDAEDMANFADDYFP